MTKPNKEILRISSQGKQKAVIVPRGSNLQVGDFVKLVPYELVPKKEEVAAPQS